MDEQTLFGEYNDNGDLVKDTQTCILTGVGVMAGDPQFVIGGKYFYYVASSALALHTDDVRAALISQLPQVNKKPKQAKE